MCGVVGVINSDMRTLWDCMKKLSYRGYDSHGFYLLDEDLTYKDLGEPKECCIVDHHSVPLGIGHVRWATHGENNLDNAHPHTSANDQIIIVHNGIWTKTKGTANLDTIELADYLEAYHCKYPVHRILRNFKNHGDNAALYIYGGELYYFVTGTKCLYTNNEIITSDLNALPDGPYTVIDNNWAKFEEMKLDYRKVTRDNDVTTYSDVNIMQNEIDEQKQLAANFDQSWNRLKFDTRPLCFIGCGSSYYAGMFGKYLARHYLDHNAYCEYASEAVLTDKLNIIAISQSGETQDLISALDDRQFQIITNNFNSVLAKKAYNVVPMNCGQELAVAATKSFTQTCLHLMNSIGGHVDSYYNNINSIFQNESEVDKIIDDFDFDRALFLGHDYDYPIALEGALKLKEVAYLSADAMPANEVKHGPIALIDDKTLSVVICNNRNKQIESNIRQIRSRGGKVLLIGDQKTDHYAHDYKLYMPTDVVYSPQAHKSLLSVIYLQMLAEKKAQSLGLNPDRPRNLSKSVTV